LFIANLAQIKIGFLNAQQVDAPEREIRGTWHRLEITDKTVKVFAKIGIDYLR